MVIQKIQRLLWNPLKLTEKVEARSAESEAVITRAKELAGRLRKNPGLARRLLTRVVISSNRLKLTLSGNELRTALGLEAVILSRSSFDLAKKISLQRCQGESRLILTHPDGTQEAQVNPALVKAISRAWVWNQQLKNKEVQSIREIAERDGFDGRYICQILPLAKLSPPLINRILEGLQPPDMTIGTLRRITSLDWREQLSDF